MSQTLIIHTDGSARGNPGPGGYGAVLQWGPARRELSQGFRRTTNNRMELMAVVEAIKTLTRPGINIVVYSDSSYVVQAVEKRWLDGWLRTGFKGKKNADLWQEYARVARPHNVKFVWVRGHADNALNNHCDQLATAAADSGKWLIDEGYEQNGVLGG